MYSVENHVDISEIRGGKGNPVISFYFDNDKNNYSIQELLNTISALNSKVGCTAKEAGNAFRKLSNALMESDSLLRPETPSNTAIPDENEPFDFLEQNAYDQKLNVLEPVENEFITSLEDL